MSPRRIFLTLGVLAAAGAVVWWLDRSGSRSMMVTPETAAKAATDALGWWSPLLPLQINQSISQSMREAPKKT